MGGGRYLNIPGARALSLAAALALAERVRESAARGARESLEALAAAVPIASIAIRACPKLPPTIEERIADNRAQTFADSVMYREALGTAAEPRGWSVHWYDRERVFRDAAAVFGRQDGSEHVVAASDVVVPQRSSGVSLHRRISQLAGLRTVPSLARCCRASQTRHKGGPTTSTRSLIDEVRKRRGWDKSQEKE